MLVVPRVGHAVVELGKFTSAARATDNRAGSPHPRFLEDPRFSLQTGESEWQQPADRPAPSSKIFSIPDASWPCFSPEESERWGVVALVCPS